MDVLDMHLKALSLQCVKLEEIKLILPLVILVDIAIGVMFAVK